MREGADKERASGHVDKEKNNIILYYKSLQERETFENHFAVQRGAYSIGFRSQNYISIRKTSHCPPTTVDYKNFVFTYIRISLHDP